MRSEVVVKERKGKELPKFGWRRTIGIILEFCA